MLAHPAGEGSPTARRPVRRRPRVLYHCPLALPVAVWSMYCTAGPYTHACTYPYTVDRLWQWLGLVMIGLGVMDQPAARCRYLASATRITMQGLDLDAAAAWFAVAFRAACLARYI